MILSVLTLLAYSAPRRFYRAWRVVVVALLVSTWPAHAEPVRVDSGMLMARWRSTGERSAARRARLACDGTPGQQSHRDKHTPRSSPRGCRLRDHARWLASFRRDHAKLDVYHRNAVNLADGRKLCDLVDESHV